MALAVNEFLEVALQQLAALVNQLAGEVARDFLGRQQIPVHTIVLHQLYACIACAYMCVHV